MLIYNFTFNTKKVLFWKRLIAQFIDFVLINFLVITYSMLFGDKGLSFWINLWALLFYGVLMDTYTGGTIGKWILGLKVVMSNQETTQLSAMFFRNYTKVLLGIIGFNFLLVPLFRGFSGIHNRIAKTSVINK